MRSNKEVSSLSGMSLKSRLCIAFVFATLFPITILFQYLFNSYKMSFLTLFTIVLVILVGWWFVFETFSSVIKIHNKTQDALRRIEKEDRTKNTGVRNEVERLDGVFSILSSKVKESMEELRTASSKMEELNKTIGQKVKVLSSILDAHALFSKSAPSVEILQFLIERLKEIIQAKTVMAFFEEKELKQSAQFYYGTDKRSVESLLRKENIDEIMRITDVFITDSKHKGINFSFIHRILGIKNFIINPVYLGEDIVGFVIIGNSIDDFSFSDEMRNILSLFSYNMSTVWERQRLYKKVEDLEINDSITGLYNDKFFFNRLSEEMKRSAAYQRPCGLIVVELTNYKDYKKKLSFIELEMILKKIVQIFKENVRPIDILGRIGENKFGIIIIERNRRQSNYVGIRLKETIYNFLKETTTLPSLVNVVVAESPIDGVDVSQLLECIHRQLRANEI